MKNILTGYLKVTGKVADRFPYVNRDGRYYSELKGKFIPDAGHQADSINNVIVRGTFQKDTYYKGVKEGFNVIIYATGIKKEGLMIYEADDRTQAYETIQDQDLRNAVMSIDGVGETYAERLVEAFNQNGQFFEELEKHVDGSNKTVTCNVPKKIKMKVVEEQHMIEWAIASRSLDETFFYNTLNSMGYVSDKNRGRDYQRNIKEWADMYDALRHRKAFFKARGKKDFVPNIVDREETIKEFGENIVHLMLNPQLILDVYGNPMNGTALGEERNVSLALSFMGTAASEIEPSDIKTLGLTAESMTAYSINLYSKLKNFKDGGFDNPRTGDTVFEFSKAGLYSLSLRNGQIQYPFTYEEVIDALSNVDSDYPVVVFEADGKQYIQFKNTYVLDQKITNQLSKRVNGSSEPFCDPVEYKAHLDAVLADDHIDLHEDQYNALLGMNNNMVNVLTGGPGTGKTTILSFFLRTLALAKPSLFTEDHQVVFCAPTGKAAKRMKESLNEYIVEYPALQRVQHQTYTIHSFLLRKKESLLGTWKKGNDGTRWLVIDESSMVDEDMLSWILSTVPETYRIIFMGDEAQLPSIGAGSVLNDLLTLSSVGQYNLTEPYRTTGVVMQNAYKIRGAGCDTAPRNVNDLTFNEDFSIVGYDDLKAIHKQELAQDGAFKQFVSQHAPDLYDRDTMSGWASSFMYKQIEDGNLDPETTMVLMPFSNGKDKKDRVAVTQYNQVAQSLMHPFKNVLPQHLADLSYDDLISALNTDNNNPLFKLNGDIQRKFGVFNALGVNNTMIFRMNDKVISTTNQYKTLIFNVNSYGPQTTKQQTLEGICGMWYARLQQEDLLLESDEAVMNGDMGEVMAVLKDGSFMVRFADHPDGQWVYYQRNPNFKDTLALSYSTTVHKSQGGEAETVVIFLPHDTDTSIMSYRELLYTAITRAKKKVVLFGSKTVLQKSMNTVKNNRHTALPYLFKEAGL